MADATVVYGISVEGSAEAQAALKKTTEATQTFSDKANHTADAIKMVGKDLDNMGLAAGKAFAMATEGVTSVVAAVGSGGMAGAIGIATVAVGALAQAFVYLRDSQGEAERSAAAYFKTFKEEVDKVKGLIKEMQRPITTESLLDKEAEILARRAANEARTWDLILLQDEAARLKRMAWMGGPYTKAIEEAERKVNDMRETIDRENANMRAMARQQQVDEEQKAFEDKAKEDAEAAKKAEEERQRKILEARKKAAEELSKNQAEWLTWQVKQATQAWDAMGKAGVEAQERANKEAEDAARMSLEAQEAILRARDAARDKSEADAARAAEATAKANEEAAKSEKHRREEMAKTAKALQEKHEQEVRNQIATQQSAAANIAFGISATVTGPIVAEYTSLLRSLGDVNRDNYRDFVLFSDELPAIIAKKTQAIMGGIAAEATGKALQSTADAARETALGLGLIAIPGMGAQAAGHFTAAGTHLAAASLYGALGTGAAVGAVGIGSMRGSGGLVGLTREERERNATRDGGGRDSGGGGGGFSSRGGSMSPGEAFVVNIAYQAGSIAPADENRAARTVASATRRARANAFDRRRMGA